MRKFNFVVRVFVLLSPRCLGSGGSREVDLVNVHPVDDKVVKISLRKQKENLKVLEVYVTRGTFSDLRVTLSR